MASATTGSPSFTRAVLEPKYIYWTQNFERVVNAAKAVKTSGLRFTVWLQFPEEGKEWSDKALYIIKKSKSGTYIRGEGKEQHLVANRFYNPGTNHEFVSKNRSDTKSIKKIEMLAGRIRVGWACSQLNSKMDCGDFIVDKQTGKVVKTATHI